jgi:glycosyltransferase involved in cell wall biosynthesis
VTTFVAATIARVPQIVFCIRTVNPTYGWTEPWFASLLHDAHSRMTPLVDRVVVNSTFLQTDHGAWLSIDPGSIPVCHNGIDVNMPPADDVRAARCQMRQALRIPDDTVVITNIGRFSREKGQLSLVDANRSLLDRTTARVVWLLCGDGPTLPDVQAAVASAEMTNVVFTGRTDAPWRILAASDIFVMPSDFEGMPNAMMEAMVAGLPCVSTNRSGICDVARDGVEALYYDPGDIVRLAQLLQSLAENPARARAMGAAAAARVRDFSVTRLVECFERVLDGAAGAA